MDYRRIEFDEPDEDLKVQFKQILRKLSVACNLDRQRI